MSFESGASECCALVDNGAEGSASNSAGSGKASASGWPSGRLLCVLFAGPLSILGLVAAGRAWTATATAPDALVRHSARHLPLQAKWGPLQHPKFITGSLYNLDACLNADHPLVSGTPASIDDCRGNERIWIFEVTRGTLRHSDGLCLEAPQPAMTGSEVQMAKCTPSQASQMWDLVEGDGQIRNRVTAKCVEAEIPGKEGTKLTMQECKSGISHQQWEWKPWKPQDRVGSVGMSLKDDWRGKIKHADGACIKAQQPLRRGSEIVIEDCENDEDGMYWQYAGKTNAFVNWPSGLCLDLNKKYNPLKVHLWQCYPSLTAQKWGYDAHTGLLAGFNGLCLQAPQAWVQGSKVQCAPCNPSDFVNKWILLH